MDDIRGWNIKDCQMLGQPSFEDVDGWIVIFDDIEDFRENAAEIMEQILATKVFELE
jgi:hypothetical protein